MRHALVVFALAAGGLTLAPPAAAQDGADASVPTCASTGVQTWRQARFQPYVFDGCRVKAWIQVPQTFSSDWSLDRREVEVRTTPAPTSP